MFFWRKTKSPQDASALIAEANRLATSGKPAKALATLRQLSIEDFGSLLLAPPATAPALAKMLPSMASDEVQQHWTGNSGATLLTQSLDFMRSIDRASREHLGHGIEGTVLDYGCGWGRLIRLLLWYVEPDQIHGVDPWEPSLDLCRQHNCPGHFTACEYVPTSVPFAQTFDLIYAFSVFTHLSEKTADAVLRVLRKSISSKGMLVITIRPPTYWDYHAGWREGYTREGMLERHEKAGFAFVPHERPAVDGDVTYGDTSMTEEFIRRRWPDWKIAGTTTNASDPLQILVFLLPA